MERLSQNLMLLLSINTTWTNRKREMKWIFRTTKTIIPKMVTPNWSSCSNKSYHITRFPVLSSPFNLMRRTRNLYIFNLLATGRQLMRVKLINQLLWDLINVQRYNIWMTLLASAVLPVSQKLIVEVTVVPSVTLVRVKKMMNANYKQVISRIVFAKINWTVNAVT